MLLKEKWRVLLKDVLEVTPLPSGHLNFCKLVCWNSHTHQGKNCGQKCPTQCFCRRQTQGPWTFCITSRPCSPFVEPFTHESELFILNTSIFNPLMPEWPASNFSFQFHQWIKHQGHKNRGNDNLQKNQLIVKQILLASTLGNVLRPVWRIWILMFGCKG